jgi:uncharacterized membrane protein YoaK (UPF0700 family)
MQQSQITPHPAMFWQDEKHGPLPGFLLMLTFVTGLVDAVSYLKLGHVFVANMTGNVLFLGFAVAGVHDFSVAATLCSVGGFLTGAVIGGRLGTHLGMHRGRYLAIATYVKCALMAGALGVAVTTAPAHLVDSYPLIALLACAMGVQNSVARRLGVPDLTTTVLTMTLTGIAADSSLAGGNNPHLVRRIVTTVTMFIGAGVGAVIVLDYGVGAVLGLALVLQIANGLAAHRAAGSDAAWTSGK